MNKQEPVIIEQVYDVPATRLWQELTDKDQMKQWYFDIEEFRPEPGFEFQFAGKGHKGADYTHLCQIKEAVEGENLSYSWRYEGYDGESLLTFELFSDNGHTRLKLTHKGIETFPHNSTDFSKESFEEEWKYITGISLAEYLARGQL